MCLYPTSMTNRKYTATKKNGGVIPEMKDERCKYVPIGCGKCIECMKMKANSWRVRLMEEVKSDKSGHFVTLTFSDEAYRHLAKEQLLDGYELDNKVAKRGVRYFLERWRKKHKKSVKHWLITELGEAKGRMHIHGIIWTDKPRDIEERWNAGKIENGHVFVGSHVGAMTVNYIVKYLMKQDVKHEYYKPIILSSAGIGANYVGSRNHENNYMKDGKADTRYRLPNGGKVGLPIYYRNYSYTDEEKEDLWIKRLDEGTRFVLGQECKSDKEYEGALMAAQEKNVRLGYGTAKIDWNKKKYEMERKALWQRTIKAGKDWKKVKKFV